MDSVGLEERFNLLSSTMSAMLWTKGCCSRCRANRAASIRWWWERMSRRFRNTSDTNSDRRSAGITGGEAFFNGCMKTYYLKNIYGKY